MLPWARRMIVEEKRWMTAEEFNDVYALCQFLPGPNIVNLSAVFGSRMRGWTGAVAALGRLSGVCRSADGHGRVLYAQFGDVDALRRMLGRHRGRGGRPDDRDRCEDGGAAASQRHRRRRRSW